MGSVYIHAVLSGIVRVFEHMRFSVRNVFPQREIGIAVKRLLRRGRIAAGDRKDRQSDRPE
jgi:hypothetical protein